MLAEEVHKVNSLEVEDEIYVEVVDEQNLKINYLGV
jgi:hypothetical protein